MRAGQVDGGQASMIPDLSPEGPPIFGQMKMSGDTGVGGVSNQDSCSHAHKLNVHRVWCQHIEL